MDICTCPCEHEVYSQEWYAYHDREDDLSSPLDTPSLSDYKNEAGEWMASPEQIRADMNWQPDPADFYDDY